MKAERKVEYLTSLAVSIENSQLMLIEAKGNSNHEQPGIPKLVPTHEVGKKTDGGLLELDFINQPVQHTNRENVLFELRAVIDLGKLPDDLKGIKVNASKNADIVLINI